MDAAGVWGTEVGDGRVIYHKEPIRSSEFIQKDFWNSLRTIKMDLMLVHARATSTGNGHAKSNNNISYGKHNLQNPCPDLRVSLGGSHGRC